MQPRHSYIHATVNANEGPFGILCGSEAGLKSDKFARRAETHPFRWVSFYLRIVTCIFLLVGCSLVTALHIQEVAAFRSH